MLKHPKKPAYNKNNISLFIKSNATNIPKKNDDMKFTIEVL